MSLVGCIMWYIEELNKDCKQGNSIRNWILKYDGNILKYNVYPFRMLQLQCIIFIYRNAYMWLKAILN